MPSGKVPPAASPRRHPPNRLIGLVMLLPLAAMRVEIVQAKAHDSGWESNVAIVSALSA
jgi:hypothetical protein